MPAIALVPSSVLVPSMMHERHEVGQRSVTGRGHIKRGIYDAGAVAGDECGKPCHRITTNGGDSVAGDECGKP